MNVNFKSDFALVLSFEEGIPTYPWRINFTSLKGVSETPSGSYTVTFDGENYFRAHPLNGSSTEVVVEFVDHSLGVGRLRGEWEAMFDNQLFGSGQQLVVTPQITEVDLVEGAGDDTIDPAVWAIVAPLLSPDGEAGSASAGELENEVVKIDDSGVCLKKTRSVETNVMGGLLFVAVIDCDCVTEKMWLHSSLGESCLFNVNNDTIMKMVRLTVFDNGGRGLSEQPDDYFVVVSPYQQTNYSNPDIATVRLFCKYSKSEFTLRYGTEGSFPGAEIYVYSRRQFWESESVGA